jgi:hypothetical protein
MSSRSFWLRRRSAAGSAGKICVWGDGKEKINEFLLGPIRYRFTAKDRAREQNIGHFVYPRFTRTAAPHHLSKTPYGNEAFELIRNNEVRDAQNTGDVSECVKDGRTPVVTWHPDSYGFGKSEARMALLERLRKAGVEVYYVEDSCEHFAVIDQSVVCSDLTCSDHKSKESSLFRSR